MLSQGLPAPEILEDSEEVCSSESESGKGPFCGGNLKKVDKGIKFSNSLRPGSAGL